VWNIRAYKVRGPAMQGSGALWKLYEIGCSFIKEPALL
jgi:hypothetical protein